MEPTYSTRRVLAALTAFVWWCIASAHPDGFFGDVAVWSLALLLFCLWLIAVVIALRWVWRRVLRPTLLH